MFTKIEFEAHEETNTVTNEEPDGGNHSATSVSIHKMWCHLYDPVLNYERKEL